MKQTLLLILAILLFSCNDTYINHKIEFKKLGACDGMSAQIGMESNIAGDRYAFNRCLPDNFDEKGYNVKRKGDTLVVSFEEKPDRPRAGYAITLDIDANPRYGHIQVGDVVLQIGEATQ